MLNISILVTYTQFLLRIPIMIFVLEAMNEKELESLKESGGLKGQDVAEAFKTPEGKRQCSKHFGKFGLLISS